MDAFFCITLSVLVLYFYIKKQKEEQPRISDEELVTTIIPTINNKEKR